MTRDDIIRMALEAGFNLEHGFLLRVTGIDEDLERFAALVAAIEEAEKRVQLNVRDFVVTVGGIENAIGKPVYWAEWPNREKNT